MKEKKESEKNREKEKERKEERRKKERHGNHKIWQAKVGRKA